MNSKDKGNIGESRIIYEFVKRNIQVALPFGDNARYDQLAEFGGKINKIQVKYSGCNPTGESVVLACASSTNHTTNKRRTTYESDVDYMAFFVADWNACLLIPIETIGSHKTMCVRRMEPKNGQSKKVHYIDEFSFDKTIQDANIRAGIA